MQTFDTLPIEGYKEIKFESFTVEKDDQLRWKPLDEGPPGVIEVNGKFLEEKSGTIEVKVGTHVRIAQMHAGRGTG